MVEAAQLPLRLEAAGCGGLRPDNGREPVGGVVRSGPMGEVDEGAGGEAVAAAGSSPGGEQQSGNPGPPGHGAVTPPPPLLT